MIFDGLSAYANLLITVIAFCAIFYMTFISYKIFNESKKSQALINLLGEREFYSNYQKERLQTERAIADLNLQLTKSKDNFNDINHLLIDGQKRITNLSSTPINPGRFLNSISINDSKIEVDNNLVFVLTPFHPSEKETYVAIVEALAKFGLRVVRGDETPVYGDILSHIINLMLRSRLVVANVSTRNPNVMYELGIAHALGKDVIMIASTESGAPFDINSRRIVFYSTIDELLKLLPEEFARVTLSNKT